MAYTFANGSGTAADPYLVATAADLNGVRDYPSAHFRQTADIDLSGYANWSPISSFQGEYNINSHKISNLTINQPAAAYFSKWGLFSQLSGKVKNGYLEHVNIYAGGDSYVFAGGVAGSLSGNIEQVAVTGKVETSTHTNNRAGGISGGDHGIIKDCYVDVSVKSNLAGGIAGVVSSITNSYSIGAVNGSYGSGGILGAKFSATVTNSYYDSQTSGCSDTDKGTPKTTAEMKTQATFVDWDFENIWGINGGYPYLRAFGSAVSGSAKIEYSATCAGCVIFAPPLAAVIEYSATGAGAVSISAKMAGAVEYSGTMSAIKSQIISGIADVNVRFFNMLDCLYFYNGQEFYYYNDIDGGPVTDIAYVPTITLGRAPTGGGTAFEDLNYLSNSWKDSFSGTVDVMEYHLSFGGLSATPVKAWVGGVPKYETTDFTVNRTDGIVTFSSPPGAGTNNVIIQAEIADLMNSNFIRQATQFIVYGGKNDNRVFACRGNTRYHSGLNNPTYWPESNYAAITSDAENLVGFGKMYDYLINLKEYSLTFTTIDSDPGGEVIFPVYPLNDEYGCLAPDSIQPVANGLIFLAQTATGAPAGVVYLSPTTVRNQLNVRVISEDINKSIHAGITGLTEYSRAEQAAAKSYIHDKKYWLRVGDRVWILDLRESDFAMGKFCWYPYDGPAASANCFLEYGDDFYIGDDSDGVIYREIDGGLNDNSKAIHARWTSPIIFCGSRSWIKDFEELHIIFGPQVMADHTLTFVTDDGTEDIDIAIEATRVFNYSNINYGAFTYGTNPYPSKQTELVGYSAEYLQWILGNNELNQGLTILAQELDYLWGERS